MKNLYKNYRSKVSSPLIYQLEKYEIVRRNPRLIGRVIKFLNYVAYLQLQSKVWAKIGEKEIPGEKRLKFQTNISDLSNLKFHYISNCNSNLIFLPNYYYTTYHFSLPPNYDPQNTSKSTIFEPYFLKLATIHWDKREEILGKGYSAELTKILQELQILYCDKVAIKKKKTYGYAMTDFGYSLLTSASKEYFYEKIYGKEKRNVKDRIRKSGYKDKLYSAPVLQQNKDNIDGIQNIEELYEISLTLSENAHRAADYLLHAIVEKDYKPLSIDPKTKRVYSPIHMLPKRIKQAAVINGKTLAACIDIRSCHPTFLGLYIGALALEFHGEVDDTLRREIESYTSLFCDPDPECHPRKVIKNQIERDYGKKLDDLKAVKDGLNHFINGSKKAIPRLFRRWLEDNYPTIFAIWDSTNIKQTGNNIAALFEFPIFRDDEVIAKGQEMGLILVDNHDELMIFGSKPKTKQFLKWFKGRAVKISGINVQFSVDFDLPEAKAA